VIFSQPGFPPTWEQNGGKATGISLSRSEQESRFKSISLGQLAATLPSVACELLIIGLFTS
jgi:hypothetical protein